MALDKYMSVITPRLHKAVSQSLGKMFLNILEICTWHSPRLSVNDIVVFNADYLFHISCQFKSLPVPITQSLFATYEINISESDLKTCDGQMFCVLFFLFHMCSPYFIPSTFNELYTLKKLNKHFHIRKYLSVF